MEALFTATGSFQDSNNSTPVTLEPAPALSLVKSHVGSFTQGSTGEWDLVVSNTTAGDSTSGTITVSDTLPPGPTLSSYTSAGSVWSCIGTTTITCTATPNLAGGASSTIKLTVSIPATISGTLSNVAAVWGGGDPAHGNSGAAAQSNGDSVTIVQVSATIAVVSGSNQSATITATTNGSGQLSEAFAANGTAGGPYSVTATSGTATTSPAFSLTNTAGTTTTAANQSATFSLSSQLVTLSATVTSAGGTVNSGTVTFTVFQGATQIGAATTPTNVSNGMASASYTLPRGTVAGSYTIVASYTGAGPFTSSSNNTHLLSVSAAGTTTTAGNQSAKFSTSAQSFTLSATVTSTAGTVNSGTVTFTVLIGCPRLCRGTGESGARATQVSNLRFVLTHPGRPDQAIAHCNTALRIRPGMSSARFNPENALAAQKLRTR